MKSLIRTLEEGGRSSYDQRYRQGLPPRTPGIHELLEKYQEHKDELDKYRVICNVGPWSYNLPAVNGSILGMVL